VSIEPRDPLRSYDRWFGRLLLVYLYLAIAAAVVLSLASLLSAADSPWTWSPAGEHHAAVVQVLTPTGSGAYECGSGCYVTLDGQRAGVLTAAHCVRGGSGAPQIRWSDGTNSAATEINTDRTGADVAFLEATHPRLQPLAIAATAPAAGERVECCGFGGPANQLRHWWTALADPFGPQDSSYTAPVIQGDSGGPIFNERHELVGVIAWGSGDQAIAQVGACNVYRSAGGPRYDVVRAFAERVSQRYGGCGPGGCGPAPAPNYGWAYPPRPQPAPPLQPVPPVAPVPSPAPIAIDYDRLAQKLLPLLASDPTFRGPPGPAGAAGKDGTPGAPGPAGTSPQLDLDALAGQVAGRLPPIYLRRVNAATGEEHVDPIRLGEGFTFFAHPHGK